MADNRQEGSEFFFAEWLEIFPDGFSGFNEVPPVDYWPSLWGRWMACRETDIHFSGFLSFLEALHGGNSLSQDWKLTLQNHLRYSRNRFFLFILWFFRYGPHPTPVGALPYLECVLGKDVWDDWLRWHKKYFQDFSILACLRIWQRKPEIESCYRYKGVALNSSLDYDAVPKLLDKLFNAFAAE